MEIKVGLVAECAQLVSAQETADHLGSGSVSVFSTPSMVLLMERTAVQAIEPVLPAEQQTVGIRIDVRHLAATPAGMTVRCKAELTEVNGRMLTFRVEAWDDVELIGEGTHERMLVQTQRFLDRVATKRASIETGS